MARADRSARSQLRKQTVLMAFQQVENNLDATRMLNQLIQEQDSAIGLCKMDSRRSKCSVSFRHDSYLNVITAQTAVGEAALTFYRAVVCRYIRIGILLPYCSHGIALLGQTLDG